ncbi:PQQ-dependent sugar dehydrogenase [Winogradskyella sp. DF17]|uniref:PQQ-dependent sugar dehydrogenase n=1 Tax=Winogradskyella pelagia TaxID=2819984 RepID=A0ABS3T569_9FLAO|nr:PQQ-dependent sugar dehydrogenase [Winogradskyella sp. DF17]MBO3117903.1 PQQ-dependent sugar dehydrogenase [Winogradskyella sp. DF17]
MKSLKPIITLFGALLSFSLYAQITFESAFPNISFSNPVEIQNAQDGSNRFFVVEQPGRIEVFPNDPNVIISGVSTFLNIESAVTFSSGQEMGLLGLAFHPNYVQNGYFYVYYTTGSSSNLRMIISRFTVDSSNPNLANPISEVILLDYSKNQSTSNHNGGKIAFGTDGYLYISIGDGGGGNDPQNNAQNINNAFGSILRIDVDVDGSNPISSNGNYEIPSDNPFAGAPGLDEIFAYGIRNTWKFSVDEVTGNIWGADVGQNEFEEINLILNGRNYGWKRFEAEDIANNAPTQGPGPLEFPVFFYQHTASDRSITGGYVYRGSGVTSLNPDINSKYIFGDYVSGRVWALDYNPTTGAASRTLLFDSPGFVSSFGLDESGELYFSSYGSNAQIFKIVDGSSGPNGIAVDGIGEWSTTSTESFNGQIRAIETSADGTIYIGGDFTVSEDNSINNIATWSETNGLNAFGTANGTINAIKLAPNGNLYVAGVFTEIDGITANNIAMWNGSSWTALGSGIDGSIAAMAIDSNNTIYVGGIFETLNGNPARNLAVWNGTSWNALIDNTNSIAGTNNEIRSLAIDDNDILYAGGNFDEAGGNPANRIATWDGTNWGSLGDGTSGFVEAITTTSDAVYVGGNFGEAGNITVNRIAKWDKTNGSWSALGNGLSNIVTGLLHDGANLYAAGGFEVANENVTDRIIVNSIAQYNETDGWSPLGTDTTVGVDNQINTIQFAKDSDGTNKIFVGGNFNSAGLTSANDFAQWVFTENLSTDDFSLSSQFKIYPNPATDKVFFNETVNWFLNDNLGRLLDEGAGDSIEILNLPSGLYFLTINNVETFKILKQ